MLNSLPQAADRLGISEAYLRLLSKRKKIACVRIGRRLLFEDEALAAFIAERRHEKVS